MAHLDTAYKLGALRAQVDFENEVNKLAAVPAANPSTMRGSNVKPQFIPGGPLQTGGAAAKAPVGNLAPKPGSAPVQLGPELR